MNPNEETPFDSVESAHEYLRLLAEVVLDAKLDVAADVAAEANSAFPRRVEAVRLVLFKLEKLEEHLKSSSRVLNDLRTLRRLLLEERPEPAAPESKQTYLAE